MKLSRCLESSVIEVRKFFIQYELNNEMNKLNVI